MRAIVSAILSVSTSALLAAPTAAAEAVATQPIAATHVAVTAGASLVRDIHPAGGSRPWELTTAGGKLFFSANDGSHGRELWVSDGTTGGTRIVRDIRPGRDGSSPRTLTRVGSRVYFSANDGSHGRELWVSDGTRAGTRMVKELTPGSKGSSVWSIVGLGQRAIFTPDGSVLYHSDGSAAGTRAFGTFDHISPFDLGQPWAHAVVRGSTLFFSARDRAFQDDALWRTDGTGAGTRRISQRRLGPAGLTRVGSTIFFGASPGGSSPGLDPLPQLWLSDGTMDGTRRVGDIIDPLDLTVLGDRLYFDARHEGTPGSSRLFRSDGSVGGTVAVRPRVGPLMHMVRAVGSLWSNITVTPDDAWRNDALWRSDGTTAGTALVYGGDGDWVVTGEEQMDFAGLGGRIYFAAGPGGPAHDFEAPDTELWASDGTTAGTLEVADIDPDGSSMPYSLTRLGSAIYFTAVDGPRGRELWRFDP